MMESSQKSLVNIAPLPVLVASYPTYNVRHRLIYLEGLVGHMSLQDAKIDPSLSEYMPRIEEMYNDEERWAKSAILNTAHCGKFSSDRTIEEYVADIWHLTSVTR